MKRTIELFSIFLAAFLLLTVSAPLVDAAKGKEKEENKITLPKNVLSIVKTNTFPNAAEEATIVEPSEFTKKLLEDVNVPIENPEIIKLLNESQVKTTRLTLGFNAEIFLGRWPLYYESENTSVIWDYQLINENELNNQKGNEVAELHYLQHRDKEVQGALMNKIKDPNMVKTMILQKTKKKTQLPLAFTTRVGANTKLNNYYHVPAKQYGVLQAYVPAINEKGQIVYGDVYLHSKGSTVSLKIKNVTKHGIGAWIPIQDHVSFSFILK